MHVTGRNHLLELLPAAERRRVLRDMERVAVQRHSSVYARLEPVSHVHFPLSAVASVVATLNDQLRIEVATIGNEGFVGLGAVLGDARETNEAFYQLPGESLAMPVSRFRLAIAPGSRLRTIVLRYAQAYHAQISQNIACNQFHTLERRLCTWILMTHDRVGEHTVFLTREFFALMLGVRQPAVGTVAMRLQKAGLIAYRRGIIDVLNRTRLEKSACECYARIRGEFERLLG